ncbi:hypothetical protein D9M71_58660 [compost metagenome]
MAGEDLPARVDACADGLGDTEDHPADQGAPEAAEAADDHRLETVEQARRADAGVEAGTHREEHPGDGHHRHRQGHGQAEDVAVVDAHQLRGGLVVRGGAEGAAQAGLVEQELQAADHRQGAAEYQQRHHAEAEATHGDAGHFQVALGELPAVGAEELQQQVLQDDRQPEGHQQRRQDVVAEGAVEQLPLQAVADHEHHRHHQRQAGQRRQAEHFHHHQGQVGRQHDEVAVGDVDQAHDAEHQRQADREHGVETAEQRALHQGIEPFHRHASARPK